MEAQEVVGTKEQKPKKKIVVEEMKPEAISELIHAKEEAAKKLQRALETSLEDNERSVETIRKLEKSLKAAEKTANQAQVDKNDAEAKAISALSELVAERKKVEDLEKAHGQRKLKVEKLKEKKRDLYEQNKDLAKEVQELRKVDRKWVKLESAVRDTVERNTALVADLETLSTENNTLKASVAHGNMRLKDAVELLLEVIKTHPEAETYIQKIKGVTGVDIAVAPVEDKAPEETLAEPSA